MCVICLLCNPFACSSCFGATPSRTYCTATNCSGTRRNTHNAGRLLHPYAGHTALHETTFDKKTQGGGGPRLSVLCKRIPIPSFGMVRGISKGPVLDGEGGRVIPVCLFDTGAPGYGKQGGLFSFWCSRGSRVFCFYIRIRLLT